MVGTLLASFDNLSDLRAFSTMAMISVSPDEFSWIYVTARYRDKSWSALEKRHFWRQQEARNATQQGSNL